MMALPFKNCWRFLRKAVECLDAGYRYIDRLCVQLEQEYRDMQWQVFDAEQGQENIEASWADEPTLSH